MSRGSEKNTSLVAKASSSSLAKCAVDAKCVIYIIYTGDKMSKLVYELYEQCVLDHIWTKTIKFN